MKKMPFIVLILFSLRLWAGGEGELEFEKSWELGTQSIVEIKGEMEVEILWGEETTLTAKGPQGLVQQLYVSDWFDQITISLEAGVGGPLDPGKVYLVLTLPPPEKLIALNKARVSWAESVSANKIFLAARDKSSMIGEVDMEDLEVFASWMGSMELRGRAKKLVVQSNGQANVNLEDLEVMEGELFLSESSRMSLNQGGQWQGRISSNAIVLSDQPKPAEVVLNTGGLWKSLGHDDGDGF